MLDYATYHLVDVTIYVAAALAIFTIAKVSNASTALALSIAVAPVAVAWMFLSSTAHDTLVAMLPPR